MRRVRVWRLPLCGSKAVKSEVAVVRRDEGREEGEGEGEATLRALLTMALLLRWLDLLW